MGVNGHLFSLFKNAHLPFFSWLWGGKYLIGQTLMFYPRGSQPFSSVYPLHTLRTFCVPPGYTFPNPCTPNIIFCIPIYYNFHTLEFFAYPMELFAYPLGLKYPRLRTPVLAYLNCRREWHCFLKKIDKILTLHTNRFTSLPDMTPALLKLGVVKSAKILDVYKD